MRYPTPTPILNPDRARWHKIATAYNDTIARGRGESEDSYDYERYKYTVTAAQRSWNTTRDLAYWLGGAGTALIVMFALFNLLWGGPFLAFAVFLSVPTLYFAVNGYRHWTVEHRTDRFMFDTKARGLGLSDRLGSVVDNYHRNLNALPESHRTKVLLGSGVKEFNQYAWKIAMDIKALQTASTLGRSKDVLNQGIKRLGEEIDKLDQAVDKLADVAVIDITDNVMDKYLDPTLADAWNGIAETRLTMHRELMPAADPEPDILADQDSDRVRKEIRERIAKGKPVPPKIVYDSKDYT